MKWNMRHSVSNVKAQSGQAIVLIALMMIGLMGVLGMAIDGGGLYFLHRDTQNAVDAALVAALYAKCAGNRNVNEAVFFDSIEAAGHQAAKRNGFENGVNGVSVVVEPNYRPPGTAQQNYVRVSITAPKPSYFIQLVYPEPLEVTSTGVGYCQPTSMDSLPPAAVVSLRKESGCSANIGDAALNLGGGGTMEVVDSAVWINSNHPTCAIRLQNHQNTLTADECFVFGGVGGYDVDCPVTHPAEQWDTLPLRHIDPPDDACDEPLRTPSNPMEPGHYANLTVSGGTLTLKPGLYCIDGALDIKGTLQGDGVVLYMKPTSSLPSNGVNAHTDIRLTAPTKDNCIPNETCPYNGLAIWYEPQSEAETLQGELHLNAQANSTIRGLVYAPRAACTLEGGANTKFIGQFICFAIRGQGSSTYYVRYEMPEFLQTPPRVSITE